MLHSSPAPFSRASWSVDSSCHRRWPPRPYSVSWPLRPCSPDWTASWRCARHPPKRAQRFARHPPPSGACTEPSPRRFALGHAHGVTAAVRPPHRSGFTRPPSLRPTSSWRRTLRHAIYPCTPRPPDPRRRAPGLGNVIRTGKPILDQLTHAVALSCRGFVRDPALTSILAHLPAVHLIRTSQLQRCAPPPPPRSSTFPYVGACIIRRISGPNRTGPFLRLFFGIYPPPPPEQCNS